MIFSKTYSDIPLSFQGEVTTLWIKIAPRRIHDLLSMCHSDIIALDTTGGDLTVLKMSTFHLRVRLLWPLEVRIIRLQRRETF